MLTQVVWWATIALETLLLVRSAQQRLAAKFPIFYFYLACVLSVDLLRFYCYTVHPGFYQELYWYTEFFSVVVGYGVIFEIYKRSLKNHPGVARLAQKVLLLVLIVTLAEVVAATFSSPSGSWASAPDPVPPEEDQIERDYKVLVTETRTTLARAITHLVRSVRP